MRYFQGMTFIEVFIALLILTVSMLTAARVQILATTYTLKAYHTCVAISQINFMVNLLMSNNPHLPTEIVRWNQLNAQLLPQGKGIVRDQHPYVINISWFDKLTNKRLLIERKIEF